MRAFIVAMVALAVITVGADLALDRLGYSSEQVYSQPNVRIGE